MKDRAPLKTVSSPSLPDKAATIEGKAGSAGAGTIKPGFGTVDEVVEEKGKHSIRAGMRNLRPKVLTVDIFGSIRSKPSKK